MRILYAFCPETQDRYSIQFRADCDRTFFDPQTGKDRSKLEVITNLARFGYQLVDYANLRRLLGK